MFVNYILKQKTIPPHQFGFKPSRSTTHRLQRTTEIIVNGFENEKFTTIAFLDISQAFDRHQGLIFKTRSLKFPTYHDNTLESFITNRTFQTRIGSDASRLKQIKASVPRESVLGPTSFQYLYCLNIPTPQHCRLVMFADDTAIITRNKTIKLSINDLQNSLDESSQWFSI